MSESFTQDEATARAHHVFTETVVAARDLGDPVDASNEGFWQIASNIIARAHGEGKNPEFYAGPEMAELLGLAKAIAVSAYWEDWASAHAICDRLFEDLDGGEEVGLSVEWTHVDDWNDLGQRGLALRFAMQFHRVPRAYQGAVADVITKLMFAMPDSWNYDGGQLPQPWAQVCCYVVFAIAERVKAAGRQRPYTVRDEGAARIRDALGKFGHGVGFH